MNKNFFISSSGVTTTIYPDSDLKVYRVSDVVLGAEYENFPTREYVGNIFIMQIMKASFFHFLNDMVGQYEILKKFIPDLKIVCVIGSTYDYDNLETSDPITAEILKEYGISQESIFSLSDYHHATFENVYYLNNSFTPCLTPKNFVAPSSPGMVDFDEYQTGSISGIVNKFKRYQQPGVGTKKIFITRKKENDKLRKFRELLNNQIKRLTPSEEDELFMNEYAEYRSLRIDEAIIRYIHPDDELEIEEYFKAHGYEIVDPGTMSYKDQVFLYSSATHVAGIAGAGIYNTIHCKPSTKVFILNTNDGYSFWHDYFPKTAVNDVFNIPEKDPKMKRFFDSKTLIKMIEESNEYAI